MFFCLGLYILTFGLAFLETAANPYIFSMGERATATQRLNLAQAFNPIGLILGLLVVQQFVLKNLQSDDIINFNDLDEVSKSLIKTSDLMVISDPYVVLGLVLIGIFILFFVSKMSQSKENESMPSMGFTLAKLRTNKKYILGLLAQILYVGLKLCAGPIYTNIQKVWV